MSGSSYRRRAIETYDVLHQQVTDRGPWQQTASGRAFFLGDPRPEEVRIEDIAHALSNQCRYNGHTKEFYSVAQHAYLVSKWMEEDGWSPELCYAGLHHDSAEAYTGDIVTQIKHIVPELRGMVYGVEVAVERALGIRRTDYIARLAIKRYDLIALATERRDLMPENTTEFVWGDMPAPREARIIPHGPRRAERAFLVRHWALVRKMEEMFDGSR